MIWDWKIKFSIFGGYDMFREAKTMYPLKFNRIIMNNS